MIFAGMLNRVMLSELQFPGLLVGGALAFEQFMAPSRVLFGQISDAHPFAGRHRVPYIRLGSALFSALAVASIPLIFSLHGALASGSSSAIAAGVVALCGLFALYGLAISLASTPYLALVIDLTDEQERPRAVGLIWCMLTVGIVAGAIATALSLKGIDGVTDPALLQPVLLGFMAKVAAVVFLLSLVATHGMEAPAASGNRSSSIDRDDALSLPQAWRLITSSRQVLVFFAFLLLFTLALFLQDPILESYGADVFGMPIAATASLSATWGIGTLAGLLLAGFWIVPRLGKFASARLGCQLIMVSLLLLVLVGLTARVPLLQLVMLLFGIASGIGTNSTLCLMLDLTLPEAAGTFVGVWGLAQAISRALGKLLGGGLLDLARWMQPGDGVFLPFAAVLLIEVAIALAALVLLERINLRQFRADTGQILQRVLVAELG
ncbi:MFS transporter [Vulcanococcus limneticus]|uniref:MFS transporter n=1 Tax=Vulcanococcus limneticus TaxID=2170428 RepID=UPI00398C099C